MKRFGTIVAAITFCGFVSLSSAPSEEQPTTRPESTEQGDFVVHPAREVKWKKGPPSLPAGAEMAVLEGDPSKPGPFVFRLKLPDGFTVPPHTHPRAERVTVIEGTFYIAMGERIDKTHGKRMPVGSFGYWPAGMKHYAWASGETILQFHGTGPWTINYLNAADDPRNADKP